MDLTYVAITVLASMIFVLAGMVGYLYWQQTHMLQHLQSLALALAAHVEQMRQIEREEDDVVQEQEVAPPTEDDDRLSVEKVEGPPEKEEKDSASPDVDDLQSKTAAELRDLLTQKGIPFGKRDSKSTLLELLKAVA
jgi:predicted negative regulator of RcsB-dependent stress response